MSLLVKGFYNAYRKTLKCISSSEWTIICPPLMQSLECFHQTQSISYNVYRGVLAHTMHKSG